MTVLVCLDLYMIPHSRVCVSFLASCLSPASFHSCCNIICIFCLSSLVFPLFLWMLICYVYGKLLMLWKSIVVFDYLYSSLIVLLFFLTHCLDGMLFHYVYFVHLFHGFFRFSILIQNLCVFFRKYQSPSCNFFQIANLIEAPSHLHDFLIF